MTKRYTAADFANAKFAEHAGGGLGHRVGPNEWRLSDSTWRFSTKEMVLDGWVPVPTKPSITTSQFEELSKDLKNRTTILACALDRAGIAIVPDPEPANTDRLEEILKEVWTPAQSARTFAEWLDSNGVTAPKEDN